MELRNVQTWTVDSQTIVIMCSRTGDGLWLGVCRDNGILVQDMTGRESDVFAEADAIRQDIEAHQGDLDVSAWNPQPELASYADIDADTDRVIFACVTCDGATVDRTACPGSVVADMAVDSIPDWMTWETTGMEA